MGNYGLGLENSGAVITRCFQRFANCPLPSSVSHLPVALPFKV
jgi:hypothetical protein